MANARKLLLLPGNARFAEFGLLLLRWATGAFLIFQSHDNVFSAARMDEFEKFMTQFGFPAPELLAPLSVYAQFAAGFASSSAC
jgi:putative oxidoreductase